MRTLRAVPLCLIAFAGFAAAQTNPSPAKLTAIQLNTADKSVQMRFWTELLPCSQQQQQPDCGGVRIFIAEKAPSGGSAGSVINHIGFFVPNMEDYVPKVSAAGYKYTRTSTGIQIIIDGPDGVRVELTSDPKASVPIRFHHVHYSTPDPKAMQAWYAKFFGAVPGKRAQWDAGDLPNANLTYAQSNGPVEPTVGRAIAGVSFEVPHLDKAVEQLKAAGVEVKQARFQSGPNVRHYADVTDPWGTTLVLSDNPTSK